MSDEEQKELAAELWIDDELVIVALSLSSNFIANFMFLCMTTFGSLVNICMTIASIPLCEICSF